VIEDIKKEITSFMSRGFWKPFSRKKVVEDIKRKLISTNGSSRRKQNKITPTGTKLD
jgi:hypothetical protein